MPKMEQEKVEIVAFIQNFMIEGTVYTLPGERLSDFLNMPKKFIPVTKASIYQLPEKKLVYQVDFLNLSVDYISAIFPKPGERGEAKRGDEK
ncbi:MAG: hypothetical protein V1653_03720 [bacterium]